jgi:hypothetical protein
MLPLFVYFSFYIHSITHVHSIHASIPCIRWASLISVCSEEGLHWVPSPESNSGPLCSSPTRYRLSSVAPWQSYASPYWATPHSVKLSSTLLSYAVPYLRYATPYTVKKGLWFSRPQPGCHLPNIPAGDRKFITFFQFTKKEPQTAQIALVGKFWETQRLLHIVFHKSFSFCDFYGRRQTGILHILMKISFLRANYCC